MSILKGSQWLEYYKYLQNKVKDIDPYINNSTILQCEDYLIIKKHFQLQGEMYTEFSHSEYRKMLRDEFIYINRNKKIDDICLIQ